MAAPRMIGDGVRELYVRGEGSPAFVGVAQAAPGQEEDKADAWTVHGAAGFHGMDQSGDGSFTVRGRILGESLRHPLPGWVNGYGRCG